MNTRFRQSVIWVMSALGLFGGSQAKAHFGESQPSRPAAESLRLLIKHGFVIPGAEPNFYRINQPLLDITVNDDRIAREKIANLLEHLRTAFGPEVNVRQVEPIVAKMGTQDAK